MFVCDGQRERDGHTVKMYMLTVSVSQVFDNYSVSVCRMCVCLCTRSVLKTSFVLTLEIVFVILIHLLDLCCSWFDGQAGDSAHV